MGALHGHLTGVHLLHWLTVAGPLAAIVVTSGAISLRRAAWLALLGVLLAVATAQLRSLQGPASAPVAWMGAPLPFARALVDADGSMRATPTLLRAYAVADVLFWVTATIVVGAVTSALTRLGRPRPRRPLPRRVA